MHTAQTLDAFAFIKGVIMTLLVGNGDTYGAVATLVTCLVDEYRDIYIECSLVPVVIFCLLGYKVIESTVMRILGSLAVALLVLVIGTGIFGNVVISGILAIIVMVIVFKQQYILYYGGVFGSIFISSGIVFFVLSATLSHSNGFAVVSGCIGGLLTSLVGMTFSSKGTVIASTSIVFGGLAGILTGILLDDRGMGQILPFVFIALGLIVQFLTNQEHPKYQVDHTESSKEESGIE